VVQAQQTNGNTQCGLIDFEGLGNNQPIPPMNLGFTTATFEAGWLSLIQAGAPGGTGNFSNEPSPVTIAFTPSNNTPNIFLSSPVSSVSFYYVDSFFNLTLELYDINNNLISTTPLPPTPNPYTQWELVTVDIGSNVISRIRFVGTAGFFGIDNLQLCSMASLVRGIPFIN
jgi:hypothetical protein